MVNHQWSSGSNDPPQCRMVGGEKRRQPRVTTQLTDQDMKEGQKNHSPRLAPGRGDGSGAEVPWGI
jgi:hypothetical protein